MFDAIVGWFSVLCWSLQPLYVLRNFANLEPRRSSTPTNTPAVSSDALPPTQEQSQADIKNAMNTNKSNPSPTLTQNPFIAIVSIRTTTQNNQGIEIAQLLLLLTHVCPPKVEKAEALPDKANNANPNFIFNLLYTNNTTINNSRTLLVDRRSTRVRSKGG